VATIPRRSVAPTTIAGLDHPGGEGDLRDGARARRVDPHRERRVRPEVVGDARGGRGHDAVGHHGP
jgi:hypothetical protein